MPNDRAPAHDDRWGDHVPWSLRYEVIFDQGDWTKFLTLVSNRLTSLIEYHEAKIENHYYFLERLSAESLGCFDTGAYNGTPEYQVQLFFSPKQINKEIQERRATDRLRPILDRLEVLQSFLFLLPQYQKKDALPSLIRDIKRFAAESNVWITIQESPPTLVPLDEPLFQKEVLGRLLPRLEARFPERAADLLRAYHDLLKGADTNTVFGNAFKALEQVARELSGVPQLQLSDRGNLAKAFPQLHGTIHDTILKLAAHRGDEAGHGRKGPDEYEIRYLLLSVCNVALVLLEYKEHGA